MGMFDNEAQQRIQEGKRQVRAAEQKAQEQGGSICHSCAENTATTTRNGDPLCSSCA